MDGFKLNHTLEIGPVRYVFRGAHRDYDGLYEMNIDIHVQGMPTESAMNIRDGVRDLDAAAAQRVIADRAVWLAKLVEESFSSSFDLPPGARWATVEEMRGALTQLMPEP